jgi:hypothetical protein
MPASAALSPTTPAAPASGLTRPPPSTASASTEATLAARASESPARLTGKRRREDTNEGADGDGAAADAADAPPPANRARTENYAPPSGLWSWLSVPLKIFAKGFRQGAGLPSPSVEPARDSGEAATQPAAPV